MLQTFGSVRADVDEQSTWSNAGLQSRTPDGRNAMVAFRAGGAGASGALIKHIRGRDGLEIRNTDDSNYSTLRASDIAAEGGNMFISNRSPTLYLLDNNHRSAMVHTNSNKFYVLRGKETNSGEWEAFNGRWPLEISLETNDAIFGADVNAASFTSRSSIRYKKDIAPLQDSLSKVNSLTGVSYVWKDTEKPDVGLIAEEVHEIYPELVQVMAEHQEEEEEPVAVQVDVTGMVVMQVDVRHQAEELVQMEQEEQTIPLATNLVIQEVYQPTIFQ